MAKYQTPTSPIDQVPVQHPESRPTIYEQTIDYAAEYVKKAVKQAIEYVMVNSETAQRQKECNSLLQENLDQDSETFDCYTKVCSDWREEMGTKALDFHINQPARTTKISNQESLVTAKERYEFR